MSAPKHTPGDWIADYSVGCIYATAMDGDRETTVRVADCVPPEDDLDLLSEDEQEANLQLIAAAPDLLAALIAIEPIASAFCEDELSITTIQEAQSIMPLIRAAIAKAQGGNSR